MHRQTLLIKHPGKSPVCFNDIYIQYLKICGKRLFVWPHLVCLCMRINASVHPVSLFVLNCALEVELCWWCWYAPAWPLIAHSGNKQAEQDNWRMQYSFQSDLSCSYTTEEPARYTGNIVFCCCQRCCSGVIIETGLVVVSAEHKSSGSQLQQHVCWNIRIHRCKSSRLLALICCIRLVLCAVIDQHLALWAKK